MSLNDEKKAPRQDFPSHEEIVKKGYVQISRRKRRIQSRPRVAQLFWVDFPHDAYEPEFVGEHPGIVVRAANSLHDTCIIVPVTTAKQKAGAHFHQLSKSYNPRNKAVSYAVCDHVYTIHVNRLRPMLSVKGMLVFPKIEQGDFTKILNLVHAMLPSPPPVVETPSIVIEEEVVILLESDDPKVA